MNHPIWILEGMDCLTYKNLPWREKRKIIVKHLGEPEKPIESVSRTGSFLLDIFLDTAVRERQQKEIEHCERKSLILPEDKYV